MKKNRLFSFSVLFYSVLLIVILTPIAGSADPFLLTFENINGPTLAVPSTCADQNGCIVGVINSDDSIGIKFYDQFSMEDVIDRLPTKYFGPIETQEKKCLEVQTRCMDRDGCPVQTWNCNERPEQIWSVRYVGDPDNQIFEIYNIGAGRVLQLSGNRVTVSTSRKSYNQLWHVNLAPM